MADFAPEFTQDPDSVLDYTVDWDARLGGSDEITTSSWFITPAGFSLNSVSRGSRSTTAWLQGGSEGQTYTVVNRVKTSGGRTEDQTFHVFISES